MLRLREPPRRAHGGVARAAVGAQLGQRGGALAEHLAYKEDTLGGSTRTARRGGAPAAEELARHAAHKEERARSGLLLAEDLREGRRVAQRGADDRRLR